MQLYCRIRFQGSRLYHACTILHTDCARRHDIIANNDVVVSCRMFVPVGLIELTLYNWYDSNCREEQTYIVNHGDE